MLRKIKNLLLHHTGYGKSRYLNFLYRYDMQQYFAHSCMNESNGENAATQMRVLVHAIEKGMSLTNVKVGFGKEKIEELVALYYAYEQLESRSDEQVLELVRSTVRVYADYQENAGGDISFIPNEFLELCQKQPVITGAVELRKEGNADFRKVAESRHSVRSFSREKITPERLQQAVRLAQTAPSACNRQASHVYACLNAEKIEKIMALHGGLKGFDRPAAILAVTGNLNFYQSEYERNTVFVDGGIFLMNLLYALEHFQIAACPVIWGAEPDNDGTLSSLLGIPTSHKIVSLVAAGAYPAGGVKVAVSYKRPTDTVLHFVE